MSETVKISCLSILDLSAVHTPEFEAPHDGADGPLLIDRQGHHQQRRRVVLEHHLPIPLPIADFIPGDKQRNEKMIVTSRSPYPPVPSLSQSKYQKSDICRRGTFRDSR